MDNLSQAGAEKMADRIKRYWQAKGGAVFTSIEMQDGCAVIRSNMVNGFPLNAARFVSGNIGSAEGAAQ